MAITMELFAREAQPRVVEAGEVIFSAGDPGDAMYVILEGEVELTIRGRLVETLGAGEPFGEMAIIDKAPRVATAVAKAACRLAVIPEKRFLFMVQQTPFFSVQIMRVMAERLRRMDDRSVGAAQAQVPAL